MTSLPARLYQRISIPLKRRAIDRQVTHLTSQVHASAASPQPEDQGYTGYSIRPVAFFNASTRLTGISLNAAFSLLASLGLQLAGIPVVRFACRSGMSLCVLGTNRDDPSQPPPCRACIHQSLSLFADAPTTWFSYTPNAAISGVLENLSLDRLVDFEAAVPLQVGLTMPLGRLVLPSVRWVLRRHHLQDDAPTRLIYRQYILSAYNVAREFSAFLEKDKPQAVVLFNGQFFPEATARWVSLQRGLRTITHEVGLQPFSAFFTTGEATAYPLHVPAEFDLDNAQNQRLDDYLSQRFQGQFSMAGIHFWPEMKGLDDSLLKRAASYRQIVPVFTNVIFDTSQPHSNVVFPHMFAWLELVLDTIREHPETLFVLRAHPDETRPGKASRESVSQWVSQHGVEALPNLIFVDSNQSLSSYELIQHSKFVMVYNSTIGLEASILGLPVLCAGRARYTQLPSVFFPATQQEYRAQLENFLNSIDIPVPRVFRINARRFLFYQLFRSSLPFGKFIEEDQIWPGFVRLKEFSPQSLASSDSPAIKTIVKGIIEQGDFLLDSDL